MGATTEGDGVVVTGQPLVDAFQRLGASDQVVAIPDWAVVDEPWAAESIGRPFTIAPEQVLRLSPELILDQPHPLVSGPNRAALEAAAERAGIEYRSLPTDPTLGVVHTLLAEVGEVTGEPSEGVWREIQGSLAELNESLAGLDQAREPPRVLVLFPAGLTAGRGTDIDVLLGMVGAHNVADLEGYRQISQEAIKRERPDRVIATSSMRKTPAEIASMPMLQETPVADRPERVLVVDPSRSMRLGPYVDEAAWMLATWLHPGLPGPEIHASLDPSKAPACDQVHLAITAPNATANATANVTATLAGETLEPGTPRLPELAPGHYRLRIAAQDETGHAFIDLMLSLEGNRCDPGS